LIFSTEKNAIFVASGDIKPLIAYFQRLPLKQIELIQTLVEVSILANNDSTNFKVTTGGLLHTIISHHLLFAGTFIGQEHNNFDGYLHVPTFVYCKNVNQSWYVCLLISLITL
jgi:hypothetical protein